MIHYCRRRVALEQGYPHNQECMSTSATSGRHMASRTINCKRRRARACACVRVRGRETCMCAGVNVHVRLAARPCPSILAVVVRMAGERGKSVFSDTALSDSVSGKGTRTVRSVCHLQQRAVGTWRRAL